MLEHYWSDPDALVDQLHREIRAGRQFADLSTDCTQDEVADILDTWERHARRTVVSRVRDDLGISQQEFAKQLGLYGQQTISKYERGITTPSRTVVKLAVSLARDDHE
ncbi:MAG: helix-turn-helix transcriptional regulator [Trueperaceae bacterium]|nr:helix-turn-helix transcriptional regulator [Trueperaceae bacterium]